MTIGNERCYPVGTDMQSGITPEYGLTKREIFAAMMMQAIISTIPAKHYDYGDRESRWTTNGGYLCEDEIAKTALSCADALITQLNKEK